MTKFLTLVGTMLKNYDATSITGTPRKIKTNKKKRGKQPSSLRYMVVLALIFASVQFMQALPYRLSLNLNAYEIQTVITNLAASLISSLILIPLAFSFATVFGNFFLSKDSFFYLALPIKSSMIWFAKFTVSFVLIAPIALGINIGYLISVLLLTSLNVMTVVNSILLTLAASLLAVSAAYLFGFILSEVFRLKKHPQVMVVLCFVFIFLFAGAYSFLSSTSIPSISEFMTGITDYFLITVHPLMQTSFEPFSHVLLSLAVVLGLAAIAALLGHLTYVKYLNVSSGDSHRKSKKVSAKKKDALITKSTSKDHEYWRLLKEERRKIFRTTAYCLNIILPLFLMPLLFTGTLFLTFSMLPEIALDIVSDSMPLISSGVFMLSFFLSNSSTCYSKDHMDFFFLAATPVNQKKLLLAKITPVLFLSLIAFVPCTLFSVLYSLNGVSVYILIAAQFIGIIINQLIGVLVDLSTGGPNNTDDLYLTKQSKMVVKSMLFCVIYIAIILVLPQALVYIEGADTKLMILLGSIISLVLAIALLTFLIIYLLKNLNRLIRKHLGNTQ